MYAVGGVRVEAQFQVAVHLLGHEWSQRGHQAGHGSQAAVQGCVGSQLVGVGFALPEPAAGAADVPVGQHVDKLGDAPAGVGGVVVVQMAVNHLHQLIQFGQYPAVELGLGPPVVGNLRWLELVDVGVVGEEGIDVPQGQQHLAQGLLHQPVGEPAGFAGMGCGEQVPAQGIRSVGVEDAVGFDDVAQPLAHFAAATIQDEAEADDVAVGDVVLHQS